MPISQELADMARVASMGMTDRHVMERTELSYASWHRLLRGEVLSEALLMKFAVGMGLDHHDVLAVARQVKGAVATSQLIENVLDMSPLDMDARRKVLALYLQLEREASAAQREHAA